MTGADVKRQVMENCNSSAPYLRHRALVALAPCIVLTAEEAALILRASGSKQWDKALALLTPDQETDPVIPGYGGSI